MTLVDRFRLPMLLIVLLLAGCSRSGEDRITAAVPVAGEVEAARVALEKLVEGQDADLRAIADEYQSRLKIRALECGRGYRPSLLASAESIRKDIGNAECFTAADQKLQQWLGMRRVGLLLAMPRLRVVPESPPEIIAADERILYASFADAAGVAVVQWPGHYQVLDLNDGKPIHAGELGPRGQLSLSANGRLLVGNSEGEAQIREAETGELLASLPGAGNLLWLDSRGAIYTRPDSEGPVYFDLATGREVRIPVGARVIQSVLPVPLPGAQPTYVLVSHNRLATLALVQGTQGWEPQLIKEVSSDRGYALPRNDSAVSEDGKAWFSAGQRLHQLTLATLESESIAFQPMRVQRVMSTHDPDQLLVVGYGSPGSLGNLFLYSIANRTLARVDRQALLSERLVYIPALRRNAIVDGARIVMIKELPAGQPVAINDFLDRLATDIELAESAAAERYRQLAGRYLSNSPAAMASRQYGSVLPAPGPAPPPVASGREGLVEAIRAGVLRLGNTGDVMQWKRRYESSTGKSLGREFDDRIRHEDIYVITGNFRIPSGLSGSNSALFVLQSGAPFPHGDPGHSAILDLKTGGCSGSICMIYEQ